MLTREGWSCGELHELLQLLRSHMTDYIYSSNDEFAAFLQQKLQPKTEKDIMDVIQELMRGFESALSTRVFRNNGIDLDDGKRVFPHEHLYETMVIQPENREGGVWHPDHLKCLLAKIETYREEFDKNPKSFFTKVQIWGRSVRDSRTKFYLWRDVYVEEEERKASELGRRRSEGQLNRIRLLRGLFENVPPAPTEPTPSPTSANERSPSKTTASTTTAPHPNPKLRMWTPEDLVNYLELLAEITTEFHEKGHSPLVDILPERMNRTHQSLLGKLYDMRKRYEKKKTDVRAAHLPDVLYDETSIAYKIFNADWNDSNDPYSLAYFAVKNLCNKLLKMQKRGVKLRPPPKRMEMRHRGSTATTATPFDGDGDSPLVETTPTPTPTATVAAHHQHHKPQIHPVHKTPLATSISHTTSSTKPPRAPTLMQKQQQPQPQYSEFVRDCAAMVKWDPSTTFAVCDAMQKAMPLYKSVPKNVFFTQVASAVDSLTRQEAFRGGGCIFRLCKQRYGSLDCFAAAVEGSETASRVMATHERNEKTTPTLNDEDCPADGTAAANEDPFATTVHARRCLVADTGDVTAKAVASATSQSPPPPPQIPVPPPPARAIPVTPTAAHHHHNKDLTVSPGGLSTRACVENTTTRQEVPPSPYGKSNETTRQIFDRKTSKQSHVHCSPVLESSPSVDHFSPDNYDYGFDDDVDVDADAEETIADDGVGMDQDEQGNGEQDEGETDIHHNHHNDNNNGDDGDTQSLASNDTADSYVSSDYGNDPHVYTPRRPQQTRSFPTSGGVHMSTTHKTIVVKQPPCCWSGCGSHVRKRPWSSSSSSHLSEPQGRKRRHQEVAASYDDGGHWAGCCCGHTNGHNHELMHQQFHKEEADTQQEIAVMDGLWGKLLEPMEQDIAELEVKLRDQEERKHDREKREKEKQWKQELRRQLHAEFTSGRTSTGATAGNNPPSKALPY